MDSRVGPLLKKLWPYGNGVFQQDLAPCQNSKKKVNEFSKKHKLRILDWPGNSSDLYH